MGLINFRAAANALLERYQFARQAGMSFNGMRDLYEVLGYNRELTTRDYRDRYFRGGLAKRIIDVYPNATWRGEMELIEDENPDVTTPFEKAWAEIEVKHQLQAKLHRVDKLSSLSTYAVLLIGAPGELDVELPKGKPEQLLYFRPAIGGGGPLNQRQSTMAMDASAVIATFDIDPKSPRFGLPQSYYIRLAEGLPSSIGMKAIHWSRIIHVADGCLEDDIYGIPGLESVWNLLDDLDKVTGGGAEAYWLRANQGMQLDIDKDMTLDDAKASAEALKDQAELYKHQMTRWLRTRGVTANVLGSDVANFSPSADAIITQIAGAKGIPKRILTGSEMGELASSQDRENWRDQVVGRQKGFAGPYIVRPLVERLIAYGYLPTPSKGEREYEVKWPNISVLTEDERREGAAAWAGTATAGEGPVFSNAEIRDKWYELEPLEPKEQEALKPAPKEIMVGKDGKPVQMVPGKKEDEEEEELRAAQDVFFRTAEDELVRVLAEAIEIGDTEVVDAVLGIRFAGGAGSGHFGHEGRPGEIGGSAPGEGGGSTHDKWRAKPGSLRPTSPDKWRVKVGDRPHRHREMSPEHKAVRSALSKLRDKLSRQVHSTNYSEFQHLFKKVDFGDIGVNEKGDLTFPIRNFGVREDDVLTPTTRAVLDEYATEFSSHGVGVTWSSDKDWITFVARPRK